MTVSPIYVEPQWCTAAVTRAPRSRSILYASLVVLLIALYAGVVLVASVPFPDQDIAAHAVGAVAAVPAVAPLREVLQNRLDRWLYGDRARPYDVLSRLGQRLEHSLTPREVFPTIAAGIAEALRLPYVAVYLGSGADTRVFAEHGRSRGWPQARIPMTHRGTVVGELVAEARSNITSTSSEVRHLVDGLRPPALDLGLVTAVREEAAHFTGPGLTVEVTADPDSPAMSGSGSYTSH